MYTSTYPIRFKFGVLLLGMCGWLAGCAGTQISTAPTASKAAQSAAHSEAAPGVLIRDKTAAAILDGIVKYRTVQKGMKLTFRDSRRVEFRATSSKSNPPVEALMIFALSPAVDGLYLTAQVFQIEGQKNSRKTSDITAGLKGQLHDELMMYARP